MMKRYFTALKNDFPTNQVGISLLVFAAILSAFWGIMAVAIIIYSGGTATFGNPWFFGFPVAFIIGAIAHILLRPAVRIHYKQI